MMNSGVDVYGTKTELEMMENRPSAGPVVAKASATSRLGRDAPRSAAHRGTSDHISDGTFWGTEQLLWY